jgi:tetratricopeptide (TPR) repeat protein
MVTVMKCRIFFLWVAVLITVLIASNVAFTQPNYIKGIYYIKQQDRNYCGPATLAMLMNYWSKEKKYNQHEVAEAIYDEKTKIAYNSDMVFFPNQEGLTAYSFNSTMEELKKLIDSGIPVIVFQKPVKQIKKGHYRVVFGYDEEKKAFVLHDPMLGPNRGIRYKDFQELWNFGDNANMQNWTLAIFPENKQSLFPDLKCSYIFHINMATAYYKKQKYDESIAEWEQAIEKSRNEPTPYPYYCLAQLLLDLDKPDEALIYAQKAVEIDNNSAFAYDVLGLVYEKKEMVVEAAEAMSKAAKLKKEKNSFILKHWLRIRELYINMFKKEKKNELQ